LGASQEPSLFLPFPSKGIMFKMVQVWHVFPSYKGGIPLNNKKRQKYIFQRFFPSDMLQDKKNENIREANQFYRETPRSSRVIKPSFHHKRLAIVCENENSDVDSFSFIVNQSLLKVFRFDIIRIVIPILNRISG
jgi:hypothetical protein